MLLGTNYCRPEVLCFEERLIDGLRQSLTYYLLIYSLILSQTWAELTWSRRERGKSRRADGEVVAKGQGLATLAVDKLDRWKSGRLNGHL